MNIILVGIGKMGGQIASRLLGDKHQIIAVDPSPDAQEIADKIGAELARDRNSAAKKFADQGQIVVWLMIPAQYVNSEVQQWSEILPEGSILIDGGNTDFRETIKHGEILKSKNIKFVDVGVSGGILGTANGFSMMAGGDKSAYDSILPILDALAKPRGGYDFFSTAGSGHYVKMVHNAIEYGMMESLAEGYRMLKEGPYDSLDLAKVGIVWQKASVIESTLNGLVAEIMNEDSELTNVSGLVAESGEAKWTLEIAKDRKIDLPVIQKSLDVRHDTATGQTNYATKLLAKLRNKFGGHEVNKK